MHYITDRVVVGTYHEATSQEQLLAMGFKSFLACSRHGLEVQPGTLYGSIRVDDGVPWTDVQKARVAPFLKMGLQRGKVFIYSDLCISRAPTAAYLYLLSTGMSMQDALQTVQTKCPGARIHPETIHGIEQKIIPVNVSPQQAAIQVSTEEKKDLLSIVLVTWNREPFVRQCLDRIVATTPEPREIIVVDNGSEDETIPYLRSWGDRIVLVECGRNLGKGKAANIGFTLSKGRWLCYFNSDILVPEGWYQEIQTIYQKIPQAGWMSLPYPNMVFKPEDEQFRPAFEERICGGMVFMERSRMEQLGGFPSDRLYGMMDLEYAKTSRLKGFEVGFVRSPKILTHLGDGDQPAYIGWKKAERWEPSPSPGPENPEPVEVIIVRFNLPEMEEQCIKAVMDYTDWPIHLTVVDNYQVKRPLGQLWNELIEKSRYKYICLLNSDTIVTPGWLERMVEIFQDGSVGVVGPSTSNCGTVQAIAKGLEPEKAIEYGKQVIEQYAGQREEAEITGFCYLLRKDVWKQVGGFHPEFGFYGQETALNVSVRRAGYQTIWRKDAFVYHYWGASIKAAEQRGEMSVAGERHLGAMIFETLRSQA